MALQFLALDHPAHITCYDPGAASDALSHAVEREGIVLLSSTRGKEGERGR